jgi:hypothetical protein
VIGIRLSLSARCPSCAASLPLDRYATAFACPACRAEVAVDADAWDAVFAHAMDVAPGERRVRTVTAGPVEIRVDEGQEWPACVHCGGTVDTDTLVCSSCGSPLPARNAPPEVVARVAGARWLASEGLGGPFTLIADPEAEFEGPDTSAFDSGDTTSNVIDRDALFRWQLLADLGFDAQGNLIFAGGDDRRPTRHAFIVWSMDAAFSIRWIVENLGFEGDARLALTHGGRALVWSRRRVKMVVLSGRDGGIRDRVGWKEPEGASFPYLETKGLTDLAVDADGTMIALLNNRVMRFNGNGLGVGTWASRMPLLSRILPDKPIEPLYRTVDGRRKRVVGKAAHPTLVDDCAAVFGAQTRIACGWDRHTYLTVTDPVHAAIACFGRDGRRRWHAALAEYGVPTLQRPGADAKGRAAVLVEKDGGYRLLRVDRGGRVEVLIEDWRRGGALGTEERFAVASDGTIAFADSGGRLRVYGADGVLRKESPASGSALELARWRRAQQPEADDVDSRGTG